MPDASKPESKFILRAADIAAMAGTPKVHFLNPNARRLNKSLGDATGLTGLGVHHIEVPVGAESTEQHVHFVEDEAVLVLKGRARVTLNQETFELGEGDFVGLPANGPSHTFHNPGPDVLHLLVIGQRLPHDVADYTRLNKRIYRNGERWNLVDHQHIVDPKAAPGSTVGKK